MSWISKHKKFVKDTLAMDNKDTLAMDINNICFGVSRRVSFMSLNCVSFVKRHTGLGHKSQKFMDIAVHTCYGHKTHRAWTPKQIKCLLKIHRLIIIAIIKLMTKAENYTITIFLGIFLILH